MQNVKRVAKNQENKIIKINNGSEILAFIFAKCRSVNFLSQCNGFVTFPKQRIERKKTSKREGEKIK